MVNLGFIRPFLVLITLLISTLFAEELIVPIPQSVSYDRAKSELGKKLFFDTRLSSDETISCASCHDLSLGGADGKAVSIGVEGRKGSINSPSVFNSRFNFVQFWNGRAKDLKEQAFGPLTDPSEMNNNLTDLIEKLKKTEYLIEFKKLYKDGLSIDNLVDAIVEYENRLITPNSPFDKFLRGDTKAISEDAKIGYKIFKDQGCIACHNGVNIGGNLYAKFGVINDASSTSKGRYEVTKNELDMYHFKVPTLRNIVLTAPYMHDGRFETLEETVEFMADFQLGKSLDSDEIKKIVAFLNTLTGELYEK